MRSLFSARSFADRAAARRAEKGAEDDDRPEARAAAAGPESAERAAPAGPSPVSRLAGGGIFKAPGVRGPVRPAATPQPVSPAEPGARHEERRAEGEDAHGEPADRAESRAEIAEPAPRRDTDPGDAPEMAAGETAPAHAAPADPRAQATGGAESAEAETPAHDAAAGPAGPGAARPVPDEPDAGDAEEADIAVIADVRPSPSSRLAPSRLAPSHLAPSHLAPSPAGPSPDAPRPARRPATPARPPVSGASPRAPDGARATGTLLTPQPPQGGLRLVPLQALAKGGRWRTEAMRSYRMPLMLWFTRGQGRITVAGFTRGYGAHNAVFIPARTMHGFEVTAQVFGTAVFFEESPNLPLPDRPAHLRVRDAVAQGEVTTILEQLGRETEGDRPLRARAIHHHAGLLSVWLDRQIAVADDARPDTASLRLVRRFTEMVEAQLYTGQGVGDYAEGLGVTPTHLSRVCRETCGRSASDILADRVTFEARRLLAETTLPVKQVAQILGYGSAAYFTRAFQNRTGQTPTQFRAAP